jgi:hypothetical protein
MDFDPKTVPDSEREDGSDVVRSFNTQDPTREQVQLEQGKRVPTVDT